MAPNFLECDRDQVLLLPPSLRDWLPEGHLAWFVIDAVDRLDLTAFYAAYRLDGQGRAAQAVTTANQIVIAAEVTVDSPDFGHLEPMVRSALSELDYAGINDTP